MIKIWIDDVREAPDGYDWYQMTSQVISLLCRESFRKEPILLDIDHDAGDYVEYGGDYIKILDFLDEEQYEDLDLTVHIHSMNPVGAENMRRIIRRNGWKEI